LAKKKNFRETRGEVPKRGQGGEQVDPRKGASVVPLHEKNYLKRGVAKGCSKEKNSQWTFTLVEFPCRLREPVVVGKGPAIKKRESARGNKKV